MFHFKYAELAVSAGSYSTVIDSVNKYVRTAGRDGEFYREALELLVQAEKEAWRNQEEARRKRFAPILPEMVVILDGSFRMGCVLGQECNSNEKPVHELMVKPLELSRYEVTFEKYDRFAALTVRARPGAGVGGR